MYISANIWIYVIVLLLVLVSFANSRTFRVAWMAPNNTYHGVNASSSVGGIKLALESISLPHANLLKNHTVRVKWYNSDCDSKSALAAAVRADEEFSPDVFIGPPCSSAMKGVAQIASVWNRPVFGWVSNDIEFRNRTIYSTLIRLLGPLNRFPMIMRHVSKMFKWTRFAMIHDEDAPYKAVAVAIAENKEIFIKSTHEVNVHMKDADIESIFDQVRKYSRIIIWAVPWDTMRRYLIVAHRLGMTKGDFAFLYIQGDLYTWDELRDQLSDKIWRKYDGHDEAARKAFDCVLHIMMNTMEEEKYNQFKTSIDRHKAITNSYWNLPPATDPDAYAAYLYEATLVWAITVNITLQENKDPSDGSHMFKTAVSKADYGEGLTGSIVLDEQGDRMLNFWLLDMAPSGHFGRILEIKISKNGFKVNTNEANDKLVHWPDGKIGLHNAPPDIPTCGFENEHCKEDFTSTIVAAVCGSSSVVVVAIIINIIFRRYRRVQLLKSMIWQVKFEDIDFVTALLHGSVRNSFKNISRRRTSSNKKKVSRTNSGGNGSTGITSANNSPPSFHKPDAGAMFGYVAYVRAMKIHMSATAADNLLKHGNYCLKCRGEINVKGKGIMKTYFLYNKNDFMDQQPSVDQDCDIRQPTPSPERHISTVSNVLECQYGVSDIAEVLEIHISTVCNILEDRFGVSGIAERPEIHISTVFNVPEDGYGMKNIAEVPERHISTVSGVLEDKCGVSDIAEVPQIHNQPYLMS